MLNFLKHDKISIALFSAMLIMLVLGWAIAPILGFLTTVIVVIAAPILFCLRTVDQYLTMQKLFSRLANHHSINRDFLSLVAPDIREFFYVMRINENCDINTYNTNHSQICLNVFIHQYKSYERVTFLGNGVFRVDKNEYKSINRFVEWVKEDANIRNGKAFM